jgi:hypothetical protein
VLEIQELQNEAPALHRWHIASMRNPWRVVALFVGLIGGFCCAVILSTLPAHPAGAAVVPGADRGLQSQPPANLVQSVSPAVTTIPEAAQAPVHDIVSPVLEPVLSAAKTASPMVEPRAPMVATDLHLADQTLNPVITTTLQPVALVLQPVMAALNPVLQPVGKPGMLSVLTSSQQSVPRTSAPDATRQAGPAAEFAVLDIQPTDPMPIPAPSSPAPQVPVTPSGTTTESSSLSFGSSPLAGHPTLGLLMPAPIITSLVLGRSESPRLLLDLRSLPPG